MSDSGPPPIVSVTITSEADVVIARQKARALGAELNFSPTDLILIASAISELGNNLITHAQQGEIQMQRINGNGRVGIALVARDNGPGIPHPTRAVLDGYSTSGGLGLGLPGVRRLMDEFAIASGPDGGTIVSVAKWRG